MIRYVAGFLFNKDRTQVALILKTRGPDILINKWNGIGGKIEPNETSQAAIKREFEEETGVIVLNWEFFMSLCGDGWNVDFYHAFDDLIYNVKTKEDELVYIWDIDKLPKVVPNVKWIIPMALESEIYSIVQS